MVNKLIILGIDGMDFDVILRYQAALPNLYGMLEKQGFPRLRSVFPADTTPAWATIYTGQDPSEHGVINFVNVGAKENAYKPTVFEDSEFLGKTFWDELNRRGHSCAVLLPMNVREGWELNGLMITRPNEGRMRVIPEEKTRLYLPNAAILGTESKFTSENALPKIRQEFFDKAREEIRLTRLAMEQENVDVLFSYFSTTDGIQHEFWRHCDPTHPQYPGANPFEHTIRDMYVLMDDFVGEITRKYPDTPVLILSDHGHGARPVYAVKINELLRQGGFLAPKGGDAGKKPQKKSLKKRLRKFATGFVKRVGLPPWAVKLARKFPVWKSLFASANDFDWDKTVGYLSDLSALKNYSYGGIRLNDTVPDKDAAADAIIDYLRGIQIEGEDKPLFEWIVRTNTFYHGKHLDKYPEIIFQMDERWGGAWELGSPVFQRGGHENIMSAGGHRWRTAVITGSHIPLSGQYEMTDIYRLILENVN